MTLQGATFVNGSTVPRLLRLRDNWVLWRYEEGRALEKPVKVPYQVAAAQIGVLTKASSTNRATWATFSDALEALENPANAGMFSGLGFVVTEGDGIVGIDLDHALYPASRELYPWAAGIVAALRTSSEVSPSGLGVRAFVRGTLEGLTGRKRGKVEMYASGRYLTVTGDQLPGTPATIEARQLELERVHRQHVAKPGESVGTTTRTTPTIRLPPVVVKLSDGEVLEAAFASKNGAAIRALYEGGTSAHGGDHSAADLALCTHLAFFANYDREQVDRLIRASGLCWFLVMGWREASAPRHR